MNIKNQLLDAIVVGSGPGGATVAEELSQRNKKVLKILATNGNGHLIHLCPHIVVEDVFRHLDGGLSPF